MKKKRLLLTALALVLAAGLTSAYWIMSLSKSGLSAYNGEVSDETDNHSSVGGSGAEGSQNMDSDEKDSNIHKMTDAAEESGNDEAAETPESADSDNIEAIEGGTDGGTDGETDEPADGSSDGEMDRGIDDEIIEDEEGENEDISERVSIIFDEGPAELQDIDRDGSIKVIVKPSESIKIDPELAEKLSKDAREAKQPLTGLFRTTMSVTQTGEGAELDFSIENISGVGQEYYSGSSQRYDFYVYDSEGAEVYRWSDNMCFATVITETKMKKGESISFAETWDYTCSDGSSAAPGEYLIIVRIIARMNNGRVIDADELTASECITVI